MNRASVATGPQDEEDVLSRWEAGELSMMEAGELLGISEPQFRRYQGQSGQTQPPALFPH
jgi:hypothetical protein